MPAMNRLPLELARLYGLGASAADSSPAGVGDTGLVDGTRAAVLAVVLPAGWEQLSSVWRGVQTDLELPAPAIAISGLDALQLWFSFASPISSFAGARLLQALRKRYLPEVGASQVQLFADAAGLPIAPCAEVNPQRWSAFVSHDLASMFAETPWLDIPPTDEGQASILRALVPIRQAAFEAALKKLGAIDEAQSLNLVASERGGSAAAKGAEGQDTDPARFLTDVMNDHGAPLALRVEAAKILLLHAERP